MHRYDRCMDSCNRCIHPHIQDMHVCVSLNKVVLFVHALPRVFYVCIYEEIYLCIFVCMRVSVPRTNENTPQTIIAHTDINAPFPRCHSPLSQGDRRQVLTIHPTTFLPFHLSLPQFAAQRHVVPYHAQDSRATNRPTMRAKLIENTCNAQCMFLCATCLHVCRHESDGIQNKQPYTHYQCILLLT